MFHLYLGQEGRADVSQLQLETGWSLLPKWENIKHNIKFKAACVQTTYPRRRYSNLLQGSNLLVVSGAGPATM